MLRSQAIYHRIACANLQRLSLSCAAVGETFLGLCCWSHCHTVHIPSGNPAYQDGNLRRQTRPLGLYHSDLAAAGGVRLLSGAASARLLKILERIQRSVIFFCALYKYLSKPDSM